MAVDFGQVYQDVRTWAEAHGIQIREQKLPVGKAGEIDGMSATMNSTYSSEEHIYYLAHALRSMVRWALSQSGRRNGDIHVFPFQVTPAENMNVTVSSRDCRDRRSRRSP